MDSVEWERTIPIVEMRPIEHEAWADDVPAGAPIVSCADRYHHTEQEQVAGSHEVCGTPYVMDQGSGAGKVVQDCQYEVYEDWCTYTVDEWQVVDTISAAGASLTPHWPDVSLSASQREGEEREESYRVYFTTDDRKANTRTGRAAPRSSLSSNWQ